MQPQDIAVRAGAGGPADVAGQQVAALGRFACQSRGLWAIVHVGRTQAALTSEREPALCTALQETRSRGCRVPRSCFWLFAWWPSSPLVQRKSKKSCMWTSRLQPSPAIPANTSNTFGRAMAAVAAVPALILSGAARPAKMAGCPSAKNPASGGDPVAGGCGVVHCGPVIHDLTRRKRCVPNLFCSPLWPSRLLPPAPSPHLCPSRPRSSPSLPRPASTSDLRGRAFAPAPTLRLTGWGAISC